MTKEIAATENCKIAGRKNVNEPNHIFFVKFFKLDNFPEAIRYIRPQITEIGMLFQYSESLYFNRLIRD